MKINTGTITLCGCVSRLACFSTVRQVEVTKQFSADPASHDCSTSVLTAHIHPCQSHLSTQIKEVSKYLPSIKMAKKTASKLQASVLS